MSSEIGRNVQGSARGGVHGEECTGRSIRGGVHGEECTGRSARGGVHGEECTGRSEREGPKAGCKGHLQRTGDQQVKWESVQMEHS